MRKLVEASWQRHLMLVQTFDRPRPCRRPHGKPPRLLPAETVKRLGRGTSGFVVFRDSPASRSEFRPATDILTTTRFDVLTAWILWKAYSPQRSRHPEPVLEPRRPRRSRLIGGSHLVIMLYGVNALIVLMSSHLDSLQVSPYFMISFLPLCFSLVPVGLYGTGRDALACYG